MIVFIHLFAKVTIAFRTSGNIFSLYAPNMSETMKRPPVVKKLCTLPADVHQWLQEQAAASLAPTNSIIVTICRKAMMDAEQRAEGTID